MVRAKDLKPLIDYIYEKAQEVNAGVNKLRATYKIGIDENKLDEICESANLLLGQIDILRELVISGKGIRIRIRRE